MDGHDYMHIYLFYIGNAIFYYRFFSYALKKQFL